MEFQYEKEMKKHGLNYADLPEDAQTGIDQIKDVSKALNMLEKSGKKPSAKTLKKVKAMDKWVCYEIYDHINNTDENDDDMPYEDDEILDEIEGQVKDDMEQHANNKQQNEKGMQVEAEIKNLYDNGVKIIDIEELKGKAPLCYDILFDTYDPDEENGVETSNYSLIEGKEDDMFHVKKR
jgi:hypothetical protein